MISETVPLHLWFSSSVPLNLLGSPTEDDVVHKVVQLDSLRGHNIDILEKQEAPVDTDMEQGGSRSVTEGYGYESVRLPVLLSVSPPPHESSDVFLELISLHGVVGLGYLSHQA